MTFADHSYLANKALWDEFFFSSITPQVSAVKVFGSPNRTAIQIAEDFFINEEKLPNRRMQPYSKVTKTEFDQIFTPAQQQLFTGGLADKVAAHLMVEGSFNINSTSVEAWRTLFSSLRGKPVGYLDSTNKPIASVPPALPALQNTPVGFGTLPNGEPVTGSRSDPAEEKQWTHWRGLTDTEINELAIATVKQVKLRGPFLSLSEFVNRRLDAATPELSAKGALQAAIDDESVSINDGFRGEGNPRKFSDAEVASMGSGIFEEAMRGPIAYGSAPYVDQADILRNFAAQLTPRGDTFVIRAYGDALDPAGNVTARAWCEAVIQRNTEYIDSSAATGNRPEIRHAGLSITNQTFGRGFEIVSFRWLNSSEI